MLTVNLTTYSYNEATPSRAEIITNQLIRMSSMPKIMSSVTFTRQQMMTAIVRPVTHSRKQICFHHEHQIYEQPDDFLVTPHLTHLVNNF